MLDCENRNRAAIPEDYTQHAARYQVFSHTSIGHRLVRMTLIVGLLLLQAPALLGQLSTEDHLADPGFWPTQDATSRSEFTGPTACASCHLTKFQSAKLTPMGSGAMRAASADILHSH